MLQQQRHAQHTALRHAGKGVDVVKTEGQHRAGHGSDQTV